MKMSRRRLLTRAAQARAGRLSSPDAATGVVAGGRLSDVAQPRVGEDLLERARSQWQLGDWHSLRELATPLLAEHPQRARLALLAAAGHLQAGAMEQARALVEQALSWGCSPRVVAQVLAAGVHNALGRAACVIGDDARARGHFERAIATVMPDTDHQLLGQARAVREMLDLGMLPDAVELVGHAARERQRRREAGEATRAHDKVLDLEVDLLRERVYAMQKQITAQKAGVQWVASAAAPGAAGPRPAPTPGRYHGLHGLDRKLEAYIDFDDGYFVELGANDGVAQSNTLYFERERGWRGVLVEPILHNFLKCRARRSPDNHFACAACVSFAYTEPTVTLAYSNLMTAPVGVETDISDPRAHALSGRVYLAGDESVVDVVAPARTLSAILDEAGAPSPIDLLSLDVEGAELEVLRGVDHARHRFRYLLVESRSPERLTDFLAQQGYRMLDRLSEHDYLYTAD